MLKHLISALIIVQDVDVIRIILTKHTLLLIVAVDIQNIVNHVITALGVNTGQVAGLHLG